MKTINQAVLDKIQAHCLIQKASAFTSHLEIDGIDYCYMSEVDPHCDASEGAEFIWYITFLAAMEGYYFIYHLDDERFCVQPELGKPYSFNFEDPHAFLQEKNLIHFDNDAIWLNGLKPDSKLACIFTIA